MDTTCYTFPYIPLHRLALSRLQHLIEIIRDMGARQASQPSSNKMIAMSKDPVNLGFTPTRYYRVSSKLLTVNACSVQ